MNGIHDMGGMQDFGPVRPEKNEPVFHEPWEGRVYAMAIAVGRVVRLPGNFRYALEMLPPADYLRMSYYEKWFTSFSERLAAAGVVTREELRRGKAARGSPRRTPATAAQLLSAIAAGAAPAPREGAPPRFRVGERVRARNLNPVGHTRLPRYARGKAGTIERDHGLTVLQDTQELSLGRTPQHVYSVRFAARELWGEQASSRDAVYIDLWDDYLEPV
ncbi:MAG TPA: nitrile hydratase subunit beta [Bryobacteraceae bacterium]|nr:nitrile hydratase subunit beta [Bryobacteraceae bacterium]